MSWLFQQIRKTASFGGLPLHLTDSCSRLCGLDAACLSLSNKENLHVDTEHYMFVMTTPSKHVEAHFSWFIPTMMKPIPIRTDTPSSQDHNHNNLIIYFSSVFQRLTHCIISVNNTSSESYCQSKMLQTGIESGFTIKPQDKIKTWIQIQCFNL